MPEQGIPLRNPSTGMVDGQLSFCETADGEIELKVDVFSGRACAAVVANIGAREAWEFAGGLRRKAQEVRERPQEPSSGDLVVDASGTLAFRSQGCISPEVR